LTEPPDKSDAGGSEHRGAGPPTEPTREAWARGEGGDRTRAASEDAVVLPIEDSLDLHAFAPRDIPSVVDEYLRAARARGFSEVRLIHGRGRGVQRSVIQSLVAAHPLVARYFNAPPERGGWGATVVVLKA
jgi:DNA-nicking Smr family endonuclease